MSVASEVLGAMAIFERLRPEELDELVSLSEERFVTEDELVFGVGDRAEALFVILDGRVVVFRDQVGHPVRLLARLAGGDWFGEMALFGEERRRNSARATEPTRLLVLPAQALDTFLENRVESRLALQIAAARRKSLDSAASLDEDQQDDSRIAIHAAAVLTTMEGDRPVEVLNLSRGGVSLSDGPARWEPGDEIRLRLAIGERRLDRPARVVWRSAHGIGIAFAGTEPRLEHQIYKLIHELTDGE